MPQFILDASGAVANPPAAEITFNDLDAFTQGYIEALFFTNQSCYAMAQWQDDDVQEAIAEGQADGDLPSDAGFSDLHPQSLQGIIADCALFQAENSILLSNAYEGMTYDESRAGNDFWYTRCGHGVGFWDRKLGDLGDKLSALCGYGTQFCPLDPSFGDAADGLESDTGYGFVFVE